LKGIKEKLLHKAGKILLVTLVNVLCKSLRTEYKNYTHVKNFIEQDKKFICAFWHGTMLVPWYVFRNLNAAALVSKSKDGELLTKVLTNWNYDVVRGSSRDGGKEAFDLVVSKACNKQSVAITPDGPTGPPFQMKAGAMVAAKKSGLPIILVAVENLKAFKLKSWDSFEIPKPFSKVICHFSEPIYVDKELKRDEVSEKIRECEMRLNNLKNG
jgi:hypothetical protein